jgi:FkbM family methyltransferase
MDAGRNQEGGIVGKSPIKNWNGLWLPEEETHLVDWMKSVAHYVDGKPTYQYSKYAECLKITPQRRRAIDVGGNIGLWSRVMCLDFKQVDAFEPIGKFCEFFKLNAPHATLHNVALSDEEMVLTMHREIAGSCGDIAPSSKRVKGKFMQDVGAALLDSYNFKDVDFIKIDCEGYEYHVVQGAKETILSNKPIIIVEQKPNKGKKYGYADDEAVKYLKSLGMKIHAVISGDYIMKW